tara:strand:- start:228 stop:464 length:237 start_codon:yes stop_codon:yes gene_type:complete
MPKISPLNLLVTSGVSAVSLVATVEVTQEVYRWASQFDSSFVQWGLTYLAYTGASSYAGTIIGFTYQGIKNIEEDRIR